MRHPDDKSAAFPNRSLAVVAPQPDRPASTERDAHSLSLVEAMCLGERLPQSDCIPFECYCRRFFPRRAP
jgi:hypothetical protein